MKKIVGLMFVLLFAGITAAQDTLACQALLTRLAELEPCTDQAKGSICAVAGDVSINDARLDLQTPTTTLADVATLAVANGVATVLATADLNATLVLFGDATLTNEVSVPEGEPVTLELTNTAGYDINLREGGGTTFATVGTLKNRGTLITDGRSADSQWFRVQSDNGIAWVNTSLVRVTGDISTLRVMDSPYTSPLQAFTLNTPATLDEACGLASAGLLISHENAQPLKLGVNGAELSINAGAVVLQANASGLQAHVIDGEVAMTANRQTVTARTGAKLTLRLDGATLLASGTPQLVSTYDFASIATAPFALINNAPQVCIAGLPANAQALQTRGGPSDAYSVLASLNASEHYPVSGIYEDDSNNAWYRLENGRWVQSDQVQTVGLCSALAQVQAPAITANQSSVPSNQSFTPTTITQYTADSGNDIMTGTCSGAPTAVCVHPAVVIPNTDGTIAWRGQEPINYVMQNIGLNRYQFNGRNFQNNANLSLDLTFTSARNWRMTMTTVFDNDPQCVHTFYYTASLR